MKFIDGSTTKYGETLILGTDLTLTESVSGLMQVNATLSGEAAVNSAAGTADRITVAPTTGDVVVDIAATYVGQATITTLGAIGTGSWTATPVAAAYVGNLPASKITSGQLAVTQGGTGLGTVAQGDILYASATDTWDTIVDPNQAGWVLTWNDSLTKPEWATASAHTHTQSQISDPPLAVSIGGTGRTSLSPESILIGSGTAAVQYLDPGPQAIIRTNAAGTAWETHAGGSVGQYLKMTAGSPNDVAAFGNLDMADAAAGTLAINRGGTNATSYGENNHFLWYNGTSIVASGYTNTDFTSTGANTFTGKQTIQVASEQLELRRAASGVGYSYFDQSTGDSLSLSFFNSSDALRGVFTLTADGSDVNVTCGTVNGLTVIGRSAAGTDNYVPLWSGTSTLDNSIIRQSGTSSIIVQGGGGDIQFQLRADGLLSQGYYTAYSYHTTSSPSVRFYAARGSEGSESNVNDQALGQIISYGYDGTAYSIGAGIAMSASGAWGTGGSLNHAAYLTINTRNTSDGTWVARWRVYPNGDLRPIATDTYHIGSDLQRASIVYCNEVNAHDGGVGDPSYMFDSSPTTGMYYNAGIGFTHAGTAAATLTSTYLSVNSGKVLIDGPDASISPGQIGLAENGGNLMLSVRGSFYVDLRNNDTVPVTTGGMFIRNGDGPQDVEWRMEYDATLGDWWSYQVSGYYKANMYLVGNNTGISNTAFISFYENNGDTRQGYVGVASAANDDLHIYSDTGNIQLNAPTGNVVFASALSLEHDLTLQDESGVGGLDIYQYGYQTQCALYLNRAEGQFGSETVTIAGSIGDINFLGYDGSAPYEKGAMIRASAIATWSASVRSTRLEFWTRNTSGALALTWLIGADGNLYPNAAEDLGGASNRISVFYTNEINADNGSAADPSYMFASSVTSGLYYSSGVWVTYAGTAVAAFQASKFRPNAVGYDLGDTTYRWDAYLEDVVHYGHSRSVPVDSGTTGTSKSVSFLDGDCQYVTVNNTGSVTISFSNGQAGQTVILYIDYSSVPSALTVSGDFGDAGEPTWSRNTTEQDRVVAHYFDGAYRLSGATGFSDPA